LYYLLRHISPPCGHADLLRLAYLAGVTGKADTVDSILTPLMEQRFDECQIKLDRLRVVFRGGQCHGCVSRFRLMEAMETFYNTLSPHMLPQMESLNPKSLPEARRRAWRSIVQVLWSMHNGTKRDKSKYYVRGVGPYFAKKLCEMLLVAGLNHQGGLYLEPADELFVADLWPIPLNSRNTLADIFPTIKNWPAGEQDAILRESLRCLERSMQNGVGGISVLVAACCFWQEQAHGTIFW